MEEERKKNLDEAYAIFEQKKINKYVNEIHLDIFKNEYNIEKMRK